MIVLARREGSAVASPAMTAPFVPRARDEPFGSHERMSLSHVRIPVVDRDAGALLENRIKIACARPIFAPMLTIARRRPGFAEPSVALVQWLGRSCRSEGPSRGRVRPRRFFRRLFLTLEGATAPHRRGRGRRRALHRRFVSLLGSFLHLRGFGSSAARSADFAARGSGSGAGGSRGTGRSRGGQEDGHFAIGEAAVFGVPAP
jgi:hypothetical protein